MATGVSSSSHPDFRRYGCRCDLQAADDYRSRKRPWGVMGAIRKRFAQDSADVAVYLPPKWAGCRRCGDRARKSGAAKGTRPGEALFFPATATAFRRSACHGPGGFKIGVPAPQGQHAAYLERQTGLRPGICQNDIYEQMRAPAKQLKLDEMRALAASTARAPAPDLRSAFLAVTRAMAAVRGKECSPWRWHRELIAFSWRSSVFVAFGSGPFLVRRSSRWA
jgi:cytochrome c553